MREFSPLTREPLRKTCRKGLKIKSNKSMDEQEYQKAKHRLQELRYVSTYREITPEELTEIRDVFQKVDSYEKENGLSNK